MALLFRKVCSTVLLYFAIAYASNAADTSFVNIIHLDVKSHETINVILNGDYFGMSVKIRSESFEHAYFILSADTFMLHSYHEDIPQDGFTLSQPIINPNFHGDIKLYTGQMEGRIELHFYRPHPKSKINNTRYRLAANVGDNCSEPNMVSRDIWRKNLAAPIVVPTCTDAEHIIIHHSAIENSSMDYMQQVQFIYDLHTKSNEWDDIGYNYLIALDGSIYEGRDGQGVCQDDNLKGAHFCAKNNNTMGVCLMGNFNKSTPSEAMINSLIKLISWKLKKEDISPYAVLEFPKNSGNQLPVIVGHRDGCNTECPGSQLYKLIGNITDSVYQHTNACNLVAAGAGQVSNKFPWVYDEQESVLKNSAPATVGQASIRNVLGHVLITFDSNASSVNVSTLPAGLYFIQGDVAGRSSAYKFRKL